MRDYEFTVVIERDEDGMFIAICPALQGCYTAADSEHEVRELIVDAIRLHVEARRASGDPIDERTGIDSIRISV